MFDLSNFVDLPVVWGLLIATAILLYVILDGFDLGVGILFPFAPTEKCRDRMMNSIAPFWDSNETWLVLGGGGLFVAFPLAYSILLPAFYMPIIMMLLGLIMRGVAFEFRFKSDLSYRRFWDYVFHFGSLGAAFCQGIVLGSFVQGIKVTGRSFAGGALDWATGFSMLAGMGVVFGYALLGATWLVMKTTDITQDWARSVGSYVLGFVAIFMALVAICFPLLNDFIDRFWFDHSNVFILLFIPFTLSNLFIKLWFDLHDAKRECRPFFISLGIFACGYISLILSIFPWIVPFHYTIWDAAASKPGLSLVLVGVAITLPLVLVYIGYCYYVFKGKASHDRTY
ncbi:cydB cytochrome d ubiquinol oxidase subunit II [Candidatus Phycorickettsia trachydisci]|uniref:CydB cytochrome d ubiquinol oxidase subunit II n=1 Tax=Candidatus Phycorickettsia trachydisci TaxID=2115978 RepID=A0A2P1PA49_9RICK|nr:cytochrome d ubiquinol oxidase subunit II [Candidatus Phycorickettsia trachydisci]AVP88143.1 cydB cytochrome d ubiquinol oxidase subunit II [Candidatus Phycorickettsia trachydisci]